jgi:phage shock protein PspC (stress-responsive transcriptional regulator)
MKKNISINISGIIFHIEEDGYEMLRKYLDSVNRYFSNFEDSTEILADIEGRMAEIFLSKLSDTKQVITVEDVNALMGIMGSVNDFKAAEENEFTADAASGKKEEAKAEPKTAANSSSQSSTYASPPKRLQRDQKRKILGGVCAGLANYFNVDAVWIRLLFALLIFAYGTALVVYIVLWIAVPGSFDLEEPQGTKKMYRDPETKVVGGVAAGIAAYFGTDVVAIRILLLISVFFFGTGVLLYIVLWIVLPEAKTMTERMEMQGEPVTLSNIESNIKKNINEDQAKEESALTKILLFPFRVLAAVINVLGKLLVPFVEVARVIIGLFIALVAFVLLFSFIAIGGMFLGIFSSLPSWFSPNFSSESGFPIEAFANTFPTLSVVLASFALVIPTVFFLLLGISIIAKKYVFSPMVGWGLFVSWFVCAIILGFTIPSIIYGFKESGDYKVETVYQPIGKTVVLKLKDTGLDDYHGVSLTLKGHDGKDFKLVQRYQSQGVTTLKAIENAKMIEYTVDFKDSIFTFDSNVRFKKEAQFKGQELDMTLYIPYNFPFLMDESMSRFLTEYIVWDNMDVATYTMTERGLLCVSCEKDAVASADQHWSFDRIEINGYVEATITQGDDYSVEIVGSNEEKQKYILEQSGNTLLVKYRNFKENKDFSWKKDIALFDEVEVNITVPSVEKVEAKGAGKLVFRNIVSDDLEVALVGAFKAHGRLTVHHLSVDVTGASELDIAGEGNNLEATITGASRLKAYDFEVTDATIETSGVSSARIYVTGVLDMDEGVGSTISYRGNPAEVRKN